MISKEDAFRLGMCIFNISMLLPETVLRAVNPYLDEMQKILNKYVNTADLPDIQIED